LLAVPIVALSMTLGAGMAQAGAPGASRPAASGIAWHKLSTINGWVSAQNPYNTGNPAWAVKNGIVYLSGSIRQSSGSSEFAVLPPAARPAHAMWITVYTLDDTHGYVTIYPNGVAYATSHPQSNAQGYTSLAGLSYPAARTRGHKVALINGWRSSQSAWNSGDPAYLVSRGVVYLSGSLHQQSGSNEQFGLLPRAARPARVLYVTVYTLGGSFGVLRVEPNGRVYAYDGMARDFTSLAGVSYPVTPAGRHKLALVHGWKSSQNAWNSGDPAYAVVGGIVYLSGSLHQAGGSNEQFATLPSGARPKHFLYIKVYTWAGTIGTVEINPSGQMFAYSPSSTDAREFTSLAAISFPARF
jgi:hypothetical protein